MENGDFQFQDFLAAEFQELLVGLMARDRDFLARSRSIIKTQYFTAAVYKCITDALFDYWDQYHELPSEDILVISVSKRVLDPVNQEAYINATRHLFELLEEDLDRPFIESELIAFCQRAEAALAVGRCWQALRTFDIDRLAKDISEVQKLPATFSQLGESVRKDWMHILNPDLRHSFPTGFKSFDLALRGGARSGELISIMAPAKRGKSLVLINLGAALFQMGNLVVHYSMEMYTEDCLKRYLACLTNRPSNTIEEHVDHIAKIVDEYEIYTPGDVIIKEYPAKGATVEMLAAHMSMLQAKYGQTPIPVIDYADLLRGPSGVEEWKELSEIYIQLRNLGRRFNVPVFTATQTNASGFAAEQLGAQHQSGSTRKGFTVDAMFGMEQNSIDYSANRFRIVPFLNRHERKDLVSYWKTDLACATMEEISETDYMNLVADVSIQQRMSKRKKKDEDSNS